MPISDVVFLDGHSPERVMDAEVPYSVGTWFHAKNIDDIALSQLGEMLGIASYDDLMSGFTCLTPLDAYRWLFSIPEALQDKIRSLEDDEIAAVAPQWAGIEEFRGHVRADSLISYISELRDFLNANEGYAALFVSM